MWDWAIDPFLDASRRSAAIGSVCSSRWLMSLSKRMDPQQNALLAALPPEVLKRWLPFLELVDLSLGTVLSAPGATMDHVYFPVTAIVSLVYEMESGQEAEVAVVGLDGLIGISTFMGGESTSSSTFVKCTGQAFRMSSQRFKKEFVHMPVMHLLLRFTQALITQITQTAACNRHHTLHQQLCRSLLLSLDRLRGSELVLTHELIANMLGVRREGVTEAASALQSSRIIIYARGRIRVLDRIALEDRSCECYAVVKKEYDRLLPGKLGPVAMGEALAAF
jgi:CRP-like cAMP-binding protein